MENELIIEVTGENEFYRTYSGRKVMVYFLAGCGDQPIHGAIYTSKGWEATTWERDGRYIDNNTDSPYDIIGKWQETLDFDWERNTLPWMNWIAMDSSGNWRMYHDKPAILSYAPGKWSYSGLNAVPIPAEYAPKNYIFWQDSLRERPKASGDSSIKV